MEMVIVAPMIVDPVNPTTNLRHSEMHKYPSEGL